MDTSELIIKVIPIIAAILLGYILTRVKVLKPSMVDAFKKIIVYVTLPAGLFIAFIKIRFKVEYAFIILSMFVACVLLYYIAKLIAKVFGIKSKYFPFLLTGFEAGMIGYALFTSVYGAQAAADFGVVDIGQVLFVFLIFVPMIINLNSKEKGFVSVKTSLKTAIKSPVIWAIILGVAGSLSGILIYEETQIFKAANSIFTFASAPTAMLISLVIGSGLKLSFKGMKMEIITAVLKVALALAIAFLLAQTVFIPLGVDKRIITALYVMCCLPAPFVIPVFMKNPSKEDLNYVSNTLSIGSVIGVVCFVIVVLIGL